MAANEVEVQSGRQIRYGAIVSYTAIAINILAGVVYTPWIIYHIGSGSYGLYTIAVSLISMFVMDFGISTAISKYIAEYRAQGKEDKVDKLVNVAVQLYLLIDAVLLVILVVVYFLLDVIYAKLTPEELEQFRVVYIVVASFNVISFPFIPLGGILSAYEKFIGLNLCDIINKVLTVLFTIIALSMGMGLYALVTINAIVGLLVIAIKLCLMRKCVTVRIDLRYRNKGILKDIFNFSIWVTVMVVAQRFIYNLTPSILGALAGTVSAAVFGVASTLEGYSYSLGNVLSNMFLPKITRIMTKNDDGDELTELMVRVGKIQLYILCVILIGFIAVGKEFIHCWMGSSEYEPAYYCAVLLIAPNLFIWPMMIAVSALTAANRVKEHAIVNVCMAIINIILEFCLVPVYGLIGAAIAICISYCFRAAAMVVLYKKYLDIKLGIFVRKTYLRLFIPMVLALGTALVLGHIIPAGGWILLAAKAAAIGTSYLVIIYCFGLNEQEKLWIKGRIRRKSDGTN